MTNVFDNTSETLSLPAKPNLEHLRKEAKQRLVVLRGTSTNAQLTDAQLLVARSYGFSSWRAMKDEVERLAPPPDARPPLPLSVVFRPHAPRQGILALHNTAQIEQSLFLVMAMELGVMQV